MLQAKIGEQSSGKIEAKEGSVGILGVVSSTARVPLSSLVSKDNGQGSKENVAGTAKPVGARQGTADVAADEAAENAAMSSSTKLTVAAAAKMKQKPSATTSAAASGTGSRWR